MAGVAVLAGQSHLTAREEVVEAAAVPAIAKAEQDAGRRAPLGKLAPEDRQRRNSDSAPYQDRPGGVRPEVCGRRKGVPERAADPDLLPGRKPGQPGRAGPDVVNQEVEPQAPLIAHRVSDREGARQKGTLIALRPAGPCGKHVELAGPR